jgi:hypothetical protein
MTTAVEIYEETETERVERWRAEELERGGFDAQSAATLATRPHVDIHVAVGLLERGCSVELAYEILL